MAERKIASYLGFARRAGKLALGVNGIGTLRGGVYLLVADPAASENTKKEIEKLAKKFACPVVWLPDLEEYTGKECCKLAAVRDMNLAAAIRSEAEGT